MCRVAVYTIQYNFATTTHTFPAPPKKQQKRKVEEKEDAVEEDAFARMLGIDQTGYSDEDKMLLGVKLHRESEKPIAKRLCPPGGQCCVGFGCREKGSHVSSHAHKADCKHKRAHELQKAAGMKQR